MKNLFLFILVFIVAVSCDDGKRPDNSGDFSFKITGYSILKNAEVTVFKNDGKEIKTAVTDEMGLFEIDDVQSATGLVIKVCKGAFYSVAVSQDVNFSGCLVNRIETAESDTVLFVDFVTTFTSSYDGNISEWFDYLDIAYFAVSAEQSTLTDSTKLYLFQQALGLVAKDVSEANGVTPETSLSTEKLFNMLLADLVDDAVFNGSTGEKFSTLSIGSGVFRNSIPGQLKSVSDAFTETDLEEYSVHLATAEADFLDGGSGSDTGNIEISIEIKTKDDTAPDLFYGSVSITATAIDKLDKTITYIECSLNDESLIDSDTTKAGFKGAVDTTAFEDDSKHKIKCSAGNGVETADAEKEFSVNNSIPEIVVNTYKTGTTTITGDTEENAASGIIDVAGTATSKHPVTLFTCKMNDTDLTDTDSKEESFKSSFVTTDFLDGKNTLSCIVQSDAGQNILTSDFFVSNRVTVTIKPYITNPLRQLDKISVTDMEGNSITDVFPDSDDKYKVALSPGEYMFLTKGGFYDNVVLETEKAFTGVIKTRAEIKLNDSAEVIITPLTTIREYYLAALSEDLQISNPASLSIQILNKHFSSTFNIMEEPINQKTMNNKTLTYIALAGFERLAQKIAVDIGLAQSEILIENLLTAFSRDFDGNHILDGNFGAISIGMSTKKYNVDSYYFRKDYAIAVKKFLMEAVNTTTLTKLSDMISNISMDDEPQLFPEEDLPIIVSDIPPSVSNLKYAVYIDDTLEDSFSDYSVSPDYSVPVFYNSFQISFTVTPEAHQIIKESGTEVEQVLSTAFPASEFDIIKIEQDSEDYSQPVNYIFEVSLLDEIIGITEEHPDGRRDFLIRVADESEERGETAFEIVLDRIPPTLSVTVPEHPVKTADAVFGWEIIESVEGDTETKEKYMRDLYYKVTHVSEDITSTKFYPISPNTLFQGTANLDSFLATLSPSVSVESDYNIKVVATDKAGNETVVDENIITVDNTAPAVNLELESDGTVLNDGDFTNAAELTFTETNPDVEEIKWNLTCSGSVYSSGDWTTEKSKHVGGLPANTDNCTLIFGARDKAGNETEITRTFKIDMMPPYIVLSSGIAQGVTYYTTKTLQLKVTDNLSGVKSVKLNDPDTSHNCILSGEYYECPVEIDGEHTYTIILEDNAGNIFSENRTFILELDPPPVITINLTDLWIINSGTVTWNQDPKVIYTCKVINFSGTDLETCYFGSNLATVIATSGQYRIKVTSAWSGAPDSKSISYSEYFHKFNPDELNVQFMEWGCADCKTNVGSTLPMDVNVSTGGNGKITEYYFYYSNHYVWGESQVTADQLTASSASYNSTSVLIENFPVASSVALGKYTKLIFKYKLAGSDSLFTKTFTKTFRFSSAAEKFYVTNWQQTRSDLHPQSVYVPPDEPLTLTFNLRPLKYMSSFDDYGIHVGLFDSSAYSSVYYGGNAVMVFSRHETGSNSFSCDSSTGICTITYNRFKYYQKSNVICGSDIQCGFHYKLVTDGYSYCEMNLEEGNCSGGICNDPEEHEFKYIPATSHIDVDTIDGHSETISIPAQYKAAQDDNEKFWIFIPFYSPC